MGFLVFHYAVLESTNVLGRSFPTKFEFFQTGRQYEQDGKQYFPQALLLCGEDLWRPLATRFLIKWPSLQAVQKAKPATLKTFYYLNGSRSAKLLEQRLTLVQRAVPVSDELALINTFSLRVQLIARQLQLLQQTIQSFDKQIAAAFALHPYHAIFKSLPGAGPVLGPRLLASLGSQRERFGQAANLQGKPVPPTRNKSTRPH